ncbi:MAG: AmmeMemoRadiSam system radical SAM enzyme [Lachnospiraceae bacterium]|nr:AmmeMemoRadiSam system radical SAM enzyme [Lachnospiraceae bacterium]
MADQVRCNICFHNCIIEEGQAGACRTRTMRDGKIVSLNYGQVTSLALDPIEKKPLNRFCPGSMILSVGSYGCNLRCPFCQNVSISMADGRQRPESEYVSPERLSMIALELKAKGNIGIAYTYNEPLMSYEYVRDTARLVHEQGMKNVLVTNGSVKDWVLDEVLPFIDAMNIDLKCFNSDYYRNVLKGDFDTTKQFIEKALTSSYVELTTLIIPDENDSEEEMRKLSAWVHDLEIRYNKKIPLHISRFFPRSQYRDRKPTEIASVLKLAEVAREQLAYVYEGNI